jgi:hypothetical protein
MFTVTALRTALFLPDLVGHGGNLFMGERRPLEESRNPAILVNAQRHVWLASVIYLVSEAALSKRAREGGLQINHRVTIIRCQRQTKTRQPLL